MRYDFRSTILLYDLNKCEIKKEASNVDGVVHLDVGMAGGIPDVVGGDPFYPISQHICDNRGVVAYVRNAIWWIVDGFAGSSIFEAKVPFDGRQDQLGG